MNEGNVMNIEKNMISGILKNFKKSSLHQNNFFEADSEVIKLSDESYLVTVDSYSDEDHFRKNDPYLLGANLAACTLSDIFACGGIPMFFCNSIAVERAWDESFIDQFAKGISSVLQECNTTFIGGDIGMSARWNYTGVAIGKADRIVTRKGANVGDAIYITGEIGRGNFEAAANIFGNLPELKELFMMNPVHFPVRMSEAALISKYASSCIDTSDGLMRSLKIISEINNTGFEINNIPYCELCILLTQLLDIPKEILMLSESGEYELLFTVPRQSECQMMKEAIKNGIQIKRIGSMKNPDTQLLLSDASNIDISDFDIWARDFEDKLEYIKTLSNYISKKARSGK
jgi:thiamine-monophosphate kinase